MLNRRGFIASIAGIVAVAATARTRVDKFVKPLVRKALRLRLSGPITLVDTSGGPVFVELPEHAKHGQEFIVIKTSSDKHPVIINVPGGVRLKREHDSVCLEYKADPTEVWDACA